MRRSLIYITRASRNSILRASVYECSLPPHPLTSAAFATLRLLTHTQQHNTAVSLVSRGSRAVTPLQLIPALTSHDQRPLGTEQLQRGRVLAKATWRWRSSSYHNTRRVTVKISWPTIFLSFNKRTCILPYSGFSHGNLGLQRCLGSGTRHTL